jgi:uncharacterized protein (TIGR02246 family)
MNGAKCSVIVGIFAATTLARSTGTTPDSVSDATPFIERANSEWSLAMKSGDADAIAEPYAIDAVFVTVDGDAVRGRTAIRDFYRSRLSGKLPVVSATIERQGVAAGDKNLVYEWGVGTVTRRSAGGTLERRGGSYLTVWQRHESGQWEIIRNVVL